MTAVAGLQFRTCLGMFVLALLGWTPLASGEGEPAAAGPSNDDCLGCHGNPVDRDKGKPIAAIGEAFAASVHGQISLGCTDCHADLQGKDLPHDDRLAKPTCVPCHEDAVTAYDNSVHALARQGSSDSDAAWCSNCHGVHDIRSSKDPASPTYHFNLAATCGKCHANAALIGKANIKAGNVPSHFQDSIHARALNKMGLSVAPTCASCHGNHEIRRASDEKSLVSRANLPKTCGTCHEGIRRIYDASVHGTAVRTGKSRAAVCIDCHTAHDQRVTDDKFKAAMVKGCGTCHQEVKRTFHGDPSKPAVATCADCHGSHDILPKEDPKSLVSATLITSTCQKCHLAGSVQIAGYNPHAESARPHRSHRGLVLKLASASLVVLVALYLVRRRRGKADTGAKARDGQGSQGGRDG